MFNARSLSEGRCAHDTFEIQRIEASVTDSKTPDLIALFETAVDVASRNMTMARALAEGYRSGVRPPDVVLEAYFASFDRDESRLQQLRERMQQLKAG